MLVVIASVFIITSEKTEIKIFFAVLFGGVLAFSIIRLYLAKEIFVYPNKLLIKWKSPLLGNREILLPLDEIDKVRFTRGGYRMDRSLRFYLNGKKRFKILLSDNDNNVVHLLRYLFEKGIKSEIIHSDQEMKLFIEGKIKEYPMKNEDVV